MKEKMSFSSGYLVFIAAICCAFIFPINAHSAWEPVDWNAVTSGLSALEKIAITDKRVCQVGSTFYRVVSTPGQHSMIYSLQKSEDGGNTWTTFHTYGELVNVWGLDAIGSNLYVSYEIYWYYSGRRAGYVDVSEDGGATLTTVAEIIIHPIVGVAALADNVYYLGGCYRVYNLQTGDVHAVPTNGNCLGRIESTGSALYVLGWDDIYESRCGITTWEKIGGGFQDIWVFDLQFYGLTEEGNTLRYVSQMNVAPVADFTANSTNGEAPLTVRFTDNSTGYICDRNWDFGDGKNSTVQNPNHTYAQPGIYTVSLTVT